MSLEKEDHTRDADFNKALHGKSAQARGGFMAMLSKGSEAKAVSVDEYFKHFDNQPSKDETPEMREKRRTMYASLTREYYVCHHENVYIMLHMLM